MARIVNSKFTPIISCVLQTFYEDGSVKEKTLHIDDMIENLRYVDDGTIKTASGRISNIVLKRVCKTVRKYNNISKMKSWFKYDNEVDYIEIDNSTEYHSNVTKIKGNEIIENAGEKNVTRVAIYPKYGAILETLLSDETVNTVKIQEGEALKDITYISKEGDLITDALLVAISYDDKYNPTFLQTISNGYVKAFPVLAIKSIGTPYYPITDDKDLNTVIANATGNVFIASGKFTSNLTFTKDVTLSGKNVGIGAISKTRDKVDFVGESVISGSISIDNGASVTLDGLTLTGDALISLVNTKNVSIKNCIIKGIVPNVKKTFIISSTENSDGKLTISNCYFGKNAVSGSNKVYNLFELNTILQNGSIISDNYFEEGCSNHNDINIYNIEDDSIITIKNNTWELSDNGIRIGIKGDKKGIINIIGNTYNKVGTYKDYAGLLLVQPYSNLTTSMKDLTINIAGTKHTDKEQLFYLYSGGNDMPFTEETVPTITVDGKSQDLSKYYKK